MPLPTRAIGFMSKLKVGTAEGNGGVLGQNYLDFGVKSEKIKTSSDEFEVGDTLSGAFKRYQPGRYMFQGTFTVFIDTTVQNFNPNAFGAVIGSVIWLNYYPTGIVPAASQTFTGTLGTIGAVINLPGGGGNDPYICPNFVIFNANLDSDVGAPVTLEFDGKCDNAFRQPATTG